MTETNDSETYDSERLAAEYKRRYWAQIAESLRKMEAVAGKARRQSHVRFIVLTTLMITGVLLSTAWLVTSAWNAVVEHFGYGKPVPFGLVALVLLAGRFVRVMWFNDLTAGKRP